MKFVADPRVHAAVRRRGRGSAGSSILLQGPGSAGTGKGVGHGPGAGRAAGADRGPAAEGADQAAGAAEAEGDLTDNVNSSFTVTCYCLA